MAKKVSQAERGEAGPRGEQGPQATPQAPAPHQPEVTPEKPALPDQPDQPQLPDQPKQPEVQPQPQRPEQGRKEDQAAPKDTPQVAPQRPQQPGQAPRGSRHAGMAPQRNQADHKVVIPSRTPQAAPAGNLAQLPARANTSQQLPATGEAHNPFFTAAALTIMTTAGVLAYKPKKETNDILF